MAMACVSSRLHNHSEILRGTHVYCAIPIISPSQDVQGRKLKERSKEMTENARKTK
jgi:hypothetical protein